MCEVQYLWLHWGQGTYELFGNEGIMPEISRFLGIVVCMYFNDHNPPHFHVRYNNFRAIMNITDLTVSDGKLPARVRGLVVEWAEIHQKALLDNWQSLQTNGTCQKIKPLV